MSRYTEKFKDPRWQKKRLEIMERDNFSCQICNGTKETLNVHHRYYTKSTDPWDYDNCVLVTLCEECHTKEHSRMKMAQERLCVSMMRLGFTSESFITIASGFDKMELPHCEEITAHILERSLSNPKIISALLDGYWAELRESLRVQE